MASYNIIVGGVAEGF